MTRASSHWLLLPLFLLASAWRLEAGEIIKSDGSSAVFPITEAVAEDFQRAAKGKARVIVGISGTGGGFKKFCRGESQVQNASRPITKEEMAVCRENKVGYFELPVAFDAMAIVVHPKNDWVESVTLEELRTIWEPTAQGKVTSWRQVNPKWPDRPLKLFGAGPDSGTFDYFTDAVMGKAKASRGDYTASEDDNTLVQGISAEPGAFGYVPYAYYEQNQSRLKLLAVHGGPKAPKKTPVLPSPASVADGTYFPLARPIFIYVNEKRAADEDLRLFTEYYLQHAAKLAAEVKAIPLPADAYEEALKRFRNRKVGTAFDGVSVVGLKLKDMFARDLTM